MGSERLMTTGGAARTLSFVSDRLVDVMLLGTSDDAELLNRLAGDLLPLGIRASVPQVRSDSPLQLGAAEGSAAVVLWTRSAVGSRWLLSEVAALRRSGPVVIALADDVEPPGDARELLVVDIKAWRSDGSGRALEPLTSAIRGVASSAPEAETAATSVDDPDVQAPSAAAAEASTARDGSPRVDLSALRPGAVELLVLADTIAGRRGVPAGAVDVVLAAVVRPALSGLDAEELKSGAAYSLYAAVPEPRDEHLSSALAAIGARSLASVMADGAPDRRQVSSVVRRSPELERLAAEAIGLVWALTPDAHVTSTRDLEAFSRHLIGIALAKAELPSEVVLALGVDDEGLRAALLAAVHARYPAEDPAQWEALLSRPAGEAVAAFHHDDTRHRDLLAEDSLDIEPHVRALALLMSSKVLKPPLAVGLFGDWGSGKTYFMRALRQEVDRLTSEARASGLPQRRLPVYRNIAQIEFNAWHFVDTDLWASLADYIFANLRITERERPEDVERRRGLYVAQLRQQGAAIRQVETERQHLQAKIELSEAELAQLRSQKQHQLDFAQQARAAVAVSPTLRKSVEAVTARLGVPVVGDAFAELETALARARTATTSARSTRAVLTGRYGTRWAVPAVAGLLLGPLLLLLTQYIPQFDWIKSVATTAAGLIAGAATWLNVATRAANETLQQIDEIDAALAAQVDAHPAVAERLSALEELKGKEQALGNQAIALREQLAKVEQSLRKLSPATLLAGFILSRNDSDDYRKHLGLASLIRRDFEALAEHIDAFNLSLEEEEAPAEQPDSPEAADDDTERVREGSSVLDLPLESEYHVNRIVLYIDDLDRCPPDTVAKVLQAVHLLLAFPLFVVVMGVDARWLSRSLTKHYEGLLASGERDEDRASASPQDYLEKIFQIPFWLRPMPLDSTGRLLTALTHMDASSTRPDAGVTPEGHHPGSGSTTEQRGGTGAASRLGDEAASGVSASATTPSSDRTQQTATQQSGTDGGSARDAEGAPPYGLRLSAVEVTQGERDFMQMLRPMLGRSPRSLTRYVNIFRLLKAVDLHDRAEGDGRAPSAVDPDEATMFLLAVLTSLPDVAQALLPALASGPDDDEALVDLVRRLRGARPTGSPRSGSAVDERQWDRLQEWLGEHEQWAVSQRVGAWDRKAERVARYSYRFDALSTPTAHHVRTADGSDALAAQ